MRGPAGASSRLARTRDGLLVLLAFGAGVVDAISVSVLGVFTAAVTANLVFIGLAIGDADAHTAARAALAFGGFALGVIVSERALGAPAKAESRPRRTPFVLLAIAALQAVFLAGWLAAAGKPEGVALDLLALASALCMGAQTAAARSWHAGIPTTYVSGTLTHLLSDIAVAGGTRAERARRFAVIAGVALGATLGALLLDGARELVAAVPVALTLGGALGAARLLRGGSSRLPP